MARAMTWRRKLLPAPSVSNVQHARPCARFSEAVGVDVGSGLEKVAAALSIYETRNGRAATASQLLGAGVDLSSQDGPEKTTTAA